MKDRAAFLALAAALLAALLTGNGGSTGQAPAPGTPPASPAAALMVFTDIGLAQPESVLHDPVADVYLISNLNGDPLAADDNGFITRVGPDGAVISERWIDGAGDEVTLHAPKGMALVGDTLYTADIDVVRLFDRATGAPTGEIAAPGATFLNDVAAGPDGTVYVTDSGYGANAAGTPIATGSDAIFAITNGTAAALVQAPDILAPNGVAVGENSDLFAVMMTDASLVRAYGPDGAAREVATVPDGGILDGIVLLLDGRLVVTSWGQQAVLVIDPASGAIATLAEGIASPADLGYDAGRSLLLVPDMLANRLLLMPAP